MSEKAEIIANHYQQTFDLTYKIWALRNRSFILLLVVIAIATVLTYRPSDTQPLLVAWVAKLLDIGTPAEKEKLAQGFPYALLQSLFLSVVFFLVFNLYHRTQFILRSYAYLGAIESEIRTELDISDSQVAFTRESNFYWTRRPFLMGSVKFVYVLLLGGLLGAFLLGRIWSDFTAMSYLLVFVDLAIAIPIILYFFGYANCTLRFDSADVLGEE